MAIQYLDHQLEVVRLMRKHHLTETIKSYRVLAEIFGQHQAEEWQTQLVNLRKTEGRILGELGRLLPGKENGGLAVTCLKQHLAIARELQDTATEATARQSR